jgi:hypothetical protein
MKEKMVLGQSATLLGERAKKHVRKLKARIEKHDRAIRDNEDTSSESSISTLGLSEFDNNCSNGSDSDDKNDSMDTTDNSILPSSCSAAPPSHQEINKSRTNPEIIIDPVSISESISHQELPTMKTNSTIETSKSSLQRAAATPPPSSTNTGETPPSNDSLVWENPPPKFFQEWRDTASTKPKAPSRSQNPRGPPGRLSPLTVNPTALLSTNRYAILEDLPLQRPSPLDQEHQRTTLSGNQHNSPPATSLSSSLPPSSDISQ